MKVLALHGFLGQGTDWEPLFKLWPKDRDSFCTPDLFSKTSSVDFSEGWSTLCDSLLESLNLESSEEIFLLGYSFGGRLALELARRYPKKWKAVVLLSTNPAFEMSPEQRESRLQQERHWVQLLCQDWQKFLQHWNSQPVLKEPVSTSGRQTFLVRDEENYDRYRLSRALEVGSVALQDPFVRMDIASLWLFGSEDHKYVQIGEQLKVLPYNQRVECIEGAGHRLLLNGVEGVNEKIQQFLMRIGQ